MWVPVQYVNFALVPTKFRALVVCVVGLGWNIILDWISHRAAKDVGAVHDEDEIKAKMRAHRTGRAIPIGAKTRQGENGQRVHVAPGICRF